MASARNSVWILVGSLMACGGPESQPEVAAIEDTHDVRSYDDRMSEALGVPFSSAELIEASSFAKERIVGRMNELADEIEPGSEWREVWERLKLQHPPEVEGVLTAYREELEAARVFVEEHRLATLPANGPEVVELGNFALRQNYPLAIYLGGRLGITTTAGRHPDPGYLVNHCDVCIPPLAVHEGYPGHHVAFSGLSRNLPGAEPRAPEERKKAWPPVSAAGLDGFWVEGWGLYAELVMLEQGYYADLAAELGAWRMMLLRVVRAELDARLHSGGMTADEAEGIYRDELQMSPEAAATEVRRHLSSPTTKATYFVGMLQLLELRRLALETRPALTLQELHDGVLEDAGPIVEIGRDRFGVELGTPSVDDLSGSPLFVK